MPAARKHLPERLKAIDDVCNLDPWFASAGAAWGLQEYQEAVRQITSAAQGDTSKVKDVDARIAALESRLDRLQELERRVAHLEAREAAAATAQAALSEFVQSLPPVKDEESSDFLALLAADLFGTDDE